MVALASDAIGGDEPDDVAKGTNKPGERARPQGRTRLLDLRR